MKSKTLIITAIVILGLLLAACGGAATAPEAAPAVEQAAETVQETVEEVVEEVAPTEAPPEPEPAAEEAAVEEAPVEVSAEQLDAAYTTFLAGMQQYGTIGLDALNEMMATDAPFLLDVRGASELEENGWIEGTTHIPLAELGANLDKLPAFDQTIVSYCGSGWRCTIAMTALEALGWENVLSLKEGSFGGWVEAGYPVMEGTAPVAEALNAAEVDPALGAHFADVLANVPEGFGAISADDLNTALVENPDLILIDVRTPAEVEERGYIDAPNVLFIPLEEFIAMRGDWPADPDAPIVVYCGSGHRSTIAMTILWSYGYTDVKSLRGGYQAWYDAGYATIGAPESGAADLDTAFNAFLDGMEGYDALMLDDFNLMLTEDPPPFILDVRSPEELVENGHIEGAVNIPLAELANNIQYLPTTDTPIVAYCGSGWRCTIAIAVLGAMGYEDTLSLKEGSFGGWVEAGYPVVEGPAQEPLLLEVAEIDPAIVATMQEMLANMPEGFGGVSVDDVATQLVENPDTYVIDVRRAEEVAETGVIDTANFIHIPLEEFVRSQDLWPEDKEAPIVLYCGSGHRCTIAMSILWSYGYTNARSMRTGFSTWVEAGYPTIDFVPES